MDQVLLLGPFVDAEHPMVREGLLSATFDQVFRDEVGREEQKDRGYVIGSVHSTCHRVLAFASRRSLYRSHGALLILHPSVTERSYMPLLAKGNLSRVGDDTVLMCGPAPLSPSNLSAYRGAMLMVGRHHV